MSIPEVLQFLGVNKMTGALSVTHADQTVVLGVKRGRIVNSSTLQRGRQLGAILLSRGLIDRVHLNEALDHQKQMDPLSPMLGQILLERRLIHPEDLQAAVRTQLEEDVYELFGLHEGSFKFEHGTEESIGTPAAELDIEPLVMEGSRRLDEWARIAKNIPGDTLIPIIQPVRDRSDLELSDLSVPEWRVLSLINGYYDVASVASRSGVGRFETFRILNSFLAAGQVSFISGEAASRPGDAYAENGGSADGESRPAQDPANSSTRLRAMFSRIRTDSEQPPDEPTPPRARVEDLNFPNPVACAAAMANRIIPQLVAMPDFYVGPPDNRISEQHWRSIVMTHPRADLVTASGNVLDTNRFDRFVEFTQGEAAFKPCYIETVDAMGRFLRTIYLLAGQRLGSRQALDVFSAAIDQYSTRSRIGYMGGVNFRDFASKVVA